jgi:outer membrane protein assembly factor BamD
MKEARSPARTIVGLVMGALLLVGSLSACRSAPPYEGLGGNELFDLGVEAFEEEDWDEAREVFERMTSRFPGHGRISEARMFLARSYFHGGEYISAAAEFERFLDLHPSHGLAPEASLGICRSYVRLAPHPQRDQEYTQRARDTCRQTAQEFAGMNVAQEAEEHRARMVERLAQRTYQDARFYQRRNAHDSAILIFQDLVDSYPETEWASFGFLGLYRSYRAIGWTEEAEEARDRLLLLHPDSEAAEELRAEEDGA